MPTVDFSKDELLEDVRVILSEAVAQSFTKDGVVKEILDGVRVMVDESAEDLKQTITLDINAGL